MRQAKFDKVVVGELSCNFFEGPGSLTAKAAFVNSRVGSTHGWTNNKNWSADTIRKLGELRQSMQNDLEYIHFEGEAEEQPQVKSEASPPPGLAEHLGDDPVQQL